MSLLLLLSPIKCPATYGSCAHCTSVAKIRAGKKLSLLIEDMYNNILRLSFKVWNSAMGLGGIATILYGILAFRVSDQSDGESSLSSVPW